LEAHLPLRSVNHGAQVWNDSVQNVSLIEPTPCVHCAGADDLSVINSTAKVFSVRSPPSIDTAVHKLLGIWL
jgi:hypothetical protein